MGMFDDVTYQGLCPICGSELTGWQSKSAGRSLDHLTPSELWAQRYDSETATQPDRVTFYTNCGKCGTWVEILLRDGYIPHSKEHKDRVMEEVRSEGAGIGEYLKRLGRERRGPVLPADILSREDT